MKKKMTKTRILLFLILAVGLSFTQNASATASPCQGWYNTSYPYRLALTVSSTMVSSTQANFPFLVSTTSASLAFTDFTGGHMGTSTANDLVVTGYDGVTKLNHEIEQYTSSTGQIILFAKSPLLTSTSTICLYYGSSTASNQQAATSTWNDYYLNVFHLATTSPNGMFWDSAKAVNATKVGTSTASSTGQIDGAHWATSNANGSGGATYTTTTATSTSFWINHTTSTTRGPLVAAPLGSTNANGGFYYEPSTSKLTYQQQNTVFLRTGSVVATSTWVKFDATYFGSTMSFYLNGVFASSSAFGAGRKFSLFGKDGTTNLYGGAIDEIRFASSILSASYIKTAYNNESNPIAFWGTGTEDPLPNSCSTFADDTTIGAFGWLNHANASTSDNVYATADSLIDTPSYYFKATNCGFSVPAGSTINGIKVEIEKKKSNAFTNISDNSVLISKGGTLSGTEHSVSEEWGLTDTYSTYGSPTDLWGLSWTADDINSTGFGMGISIIDDAVPGTASIDHIRMTVTYTAAAAAASSTIVSSQQVIFID